MNMHSLRKLCKNIFYNGWHENYHIKHKDVLVDIDNIVTKAAHLTYEKYSDKILNNFEDIKQNIYLELFYNCNRDWLKFHSELELKLYIYKVANEIIE